MISTTSPQVAAEATKKILALYDTIPASDPQQFAAGLMATLLIFPPAVVTKAADPVHGIPARVSYLNLAKMREWLDKEAEQYWTEQNRIERGNRKALPEPEIDPEERKRVSEGLRDLVQHLKSGFGPSTAA